MKRKGHKGRAGGSRRALRAGYAVSLLGTILVAFPAALLGPDNTLWDGSPLLLLFQEMSLASAPRVGDHFDLSWFSGSHASRLCAVSMYTKFPEEPFDVPFVMDTMDRVPADVRALAYIDACEEVYRELPADGQQRAALDALDPRPELIGAVNVTVPFIHGDWFTGLAAREVKQKREKVLHRPDLERLWKPVEALLAEHPDGDQLVRNGFRPLQEPWIRADEVADALVAGKVAVFDATEVLPRGLFNISVVDIADMHGELADTIPAYHDEGASKGRQYVESLRAYADRMRRAMLSGHEASYAGGFHLGGTATYSHDFHRWKYWDMEEIQPVHCRVPPGAFWAVADALMGEWARRMLGMARFRSHRVTFNARRLPKLPEFDLLRAIGQPSWAARMQNLLWIGPGPWNWHFDEEDNLLIALNGDMWVVVFADHNDTDALTGGVRLAGSVAGEAVLPSAFTTLFMERNGAWFQKYPFYFFKLKPGMAVTVPSRTVHTVLTSDSTRILMNAFIAPKFMAPERRTGASWFAPGHQSDTYLAMRALKQASMGRLWDTKGVGGFFYGSKLEFL